MIITSLLTTLFFLFITIDAYLVGRQLLKFIFMEIQITALHKIIATALGYGVLAYGVLLLGLIGYLKPVFILTWLILSFSLSLFLSRPKVRFFSYISMLKGITKASPGVKGIIAVCTLILGLSFIQSLTPPWDYDGLMYHLEGPRQFLEAARIILLEDVWGANGPFTIEMLFTIGEAFNLPSLSKLIHLSYAILLSLATLLAGKELFGRITGIYSLIIIVGIPIFPIWATFAYADMAWALYEFLGFFALLSWMKKQETSWLALSGILWGLALGSKYMALAGFGLSGLFVLLLSRGQGLKIILFHGLLFGIVGVIVGSPWYIKNWILGGNPVYPLYFGGVGWPEDRVYWLMTYLNSFGTGHGLLDFLFLPVNLYLKHEYFATFLGSVEIPSLLFPVLIFFFLIKREKTASLLAVFLLFRFMLWSLSSHQVRFLLPLFPGLAILSAYTLVGLKEMFFRIRFLSRVMIPVALTSVLLLTVFYSCSFFFSISPIGVVLGVEDQSHFLSRNIRDYGGIAYANLTLDSSETILFLWDGMGYYCDGRCYPDTEHSQWTQLISKTRDTSKIARLLKAHGITHLFYSEVDFRFLSHHDPTGYHRDAADFFFEEFLSKCGKTEYRDNNSLVIKIICS